MSKVLVDRELLWQVAKPVLFRSQEDAHADACAELRTILAQPAEAEGVGRCDQIKCWQCNVLTSLEERSEEDGCFPRCGVEIDLSDYLIEANKALSAVTAERDRLREEMAELWKRIDKFQSQSHGITALAEIERLRAEVERLLGAMRQIRYASNNGPVSENNAGCIRRIEQIADAAMAAKEE